MLARVTVEKSSASAELDVSRARLSGLLGSGDASSLDVSDDLTLERWGTSDERDDAVLAETSAEMTGRGSEMALGWRFWAVWRAQDGVITYHHAYSRREDALAHLEGTTGV